MRPAIPAFMLAAVLAGPLAAAPAQGQLAAAPSTAPADTLGRAAAAPADTLDEAAVDLQLWPLELRTYDLVWVPTGTISEARGWGAGAETVLPFRLDGDRRTPPSEISLEFLATLKGQQRVELTTDLFWDHGRNYLRLRLDYDGLARRFYGLGPTSDRDDREYYKPHQVLAYVEGARRIGPGLAIGPRLELHRQTITDIQQGGLLDCGDVCTGFDVTEVGLGGILRLDKRDQTWWPTRGVFFQILAQAFSHELGGADDFTVFNADLRGYRALGRRHVLAGQVFYYGVNGRPPFWRLASLGGRHHTRAYHRDRWLDRVMTAAQLEWRWRSTRRVGLVVFGGAAVVGHEVRTFEARHVRPTVGLGLRVYAENDHDAVPVRLDLAFGYQAVRLTLGIGEAF